MMAELAAQASVTLAKKWTNPEYKQRVMRRKIAGYVARLLRKFSTEEITPAVYEAHRDNNWVPRLETALKYFQSFNHLVEAGRNYNHRICSKRWLSETG